MSKRLLKSTALSRFILFLFYLQNVYIHVRVHVRVVTKTLTITENAYGLLAENKLEHESFSQEIQRLLAKRQRKSLFDFFGILTEQEGERVEQVINKRREFNRRRKESEHA